MEDIQIIELYLSRNEDAIEKTDEKYGNYCKTIAYNILENSADAEECKSDTYFKLWNSIPPIIPQIFSAFIAKIVRNIALDRYRLDNRAKRGGRVCLSLEELEECVGEETVEEKIYSKELGRLISDFLRGESEKARIVFIKKYFFEKSVNEIAKELYLTDANVKTTLSRTRARLHDYLKEREVCF